MSKAGVTTVREGERFIAERLSFIGQLLAAVVDRCVKKEMACIAGHSSIRLN
jgi:hypothetical protein